MLQSVKTSQTLFAFDTTFKGCINCIKSTLYEPLKEQHPL